MDGEMIGGFTMFKIYLKETFKRLWVNLPLRYKVEEDFLDP